jgi:hypothetical protein
MGRLAFVVFEQPRRRRGGAREQIRALRRIADQRFEQLTDGPERERLLQLRASRLKPRDPYPLGSDARFARQLGLADASGSLDQDKGSVSSARAAETFHERLNLALSLKQSCRPRRHIFTIHPSAPVVVRVKTLG